MKFLITEVDRDYNAWVSDTVMEFNSTPEADEYCKNESWAGAFYYATQLEFLERKYGNQ